MHSGAGRITPLRMRTMSLWEYGDSDWKVSLQSLFADGIKTQLTGEVEPREELKAVSTAYCQRSLGSSCASFVALVMLHIAGMMVFMLSL